MSIRRAERTLEHLWANAMNDLPEDRGRPRRHSPPASDVESCNERSRASRGSSVGSAPKLRGPGLCVKLCAVLCIALVGTTLVAGAIAIAGLPVVVQAEAALAGAVGRTRALMASAPTGGERGATPAPTATPTPLPAILRRLKLVQRATPPARGADAASVKRAFPAWGGPGEWKLDEVLADLVLAIATLADERTTPN